jgi:hypothetical protein
MTEQALNTVDTESINTGFDLEGINDPMDALGNFDLEQMEQADGGGPGDPVKKKPVTMADLKKDYQIDMQQSKMLAEIGIPKMADESRNKFQAARVVEFDAKKLNVDRYLGYGKETFNKVGFSPFIDNEAKFNQNTTIWQDFGRMTSVFGGLVYEGGVSGYRSIGGMLSGDSFFTPDDETAENFARLQSIGMSSRSGGLAGLGAFANNFVLNSAYTVGIAGSIIAEEAALFGLTVATEGAMGGLAAMRTSANAARMGRALKQAFNTNAVQNIATGGFQLAKSLSKVGDAKNFYTAVKTGATTFGKGAFQFINPLTRTVDDLTDIARGSASVRNMSNLAKAKQTFGSFYRDVRDTNLALSESKLEGGSAKIDKVNELLARYENENGRPAEGKDLEMIYKQADDTGHGVTAVNFPIIYMTNRVVLDGLFKFRGLKTLDEAGTLATKGIGFKKGVGFYDDLGKSWLKNGAKSLLKPKAYIGMGVGYFRRNLMEGVQENLQNVTSDAVSAYYDGVYKDRTLGGFDYAAGHAWNALGKEVTSMRGLETFASGFLMGGFTGKAQNLFAKDVPGIYYRVAQPTKYAEYKANKAKTRQDAIAGLNELYNNPMKYFSSRNESAVVQKHTSDVMNQAEVEGDAKTFQDAKDLKMFDHIFTALDNGTYDNLLGAYKELSKMDSKDLANFLGIPESEKSSEKLQEILGRAEQIKERYETISSQFKNPFTPTKLKRGTPEFTREAIAFRAFESAKKTAIASQYNFDRALERMNGLYDNLASDRPIAKSSASDITTLTNMGILDDEISLLDKEIKSYDGSSDKKQQELVDQKKEKLDRLMDYRDKLRTHLENASKVETEEDGQIKINFAQDTVDPLKESYKAYLRHIAKVNEDYMFNDKVDDSFAKLLDYYGLNQDAANYSKVVNTLLDPTNLYKHAEQLNARFTDLFTNKEADINDRVESAQRMMEMSELVKALAAQGVMLEPAELEEFVKSGKRPTTFIDAATLKDLEPGSQKFIAAQAIMNIDEQITTPDVTPATETAPASTTAAPTAAPVEASASTIDVGIEPELQIKLEDAFNQFVEETGSEMTFEDFVKVSPRAARIKTAFNKGKAPAVTTTTAAAPVTETTPAAAEPVAADTETDTQFGENMLSGLKQLNIDTQKADIEKRRQAELETLKLLHKSDIHEAGVTVDPDTPKGAKSPLWKVNVSRFSKAVGDNGGMLYHEGLSQGGFATKQEAEDYLKEVEEKLGVEDKINAKYDAELAALEGQPASTPEAPVNLNAELVKTLTEERDQKLSDLMPLYATARKTMMQLGDEALDPEDRNILADPVKYLEGRIAQGEYSLQLDIDKLKALDTNNPDNAKEAENLQRDIDTEKIVLEKTNIKLEQIKAVVAEYNDKMSRIGETSVAATPAQTTSVEISSNAKGLAAALTNPTELAKKKGNLTASYPVTVRGKEYADAEAAYQALKGTATKDDGPNSTYNLMVEILKAKLEQHPRLVSEIDKAGGESWLSKATHQPTNKNTVWETGGKNWFIKALTEAYTGTKETQTVETAPTAAQKTGVQTAQDLIDSVSSIRDLPDLNRADSGPVTIDLIELVSTGQVKSKDIVPMLVKKRAELLKNISPSDLQKGDIVTFVDGRKGFVKSVSPTEVSVKIAGSPSGVAEVISSQALSSSIANVEPGKAISMEPTPDIEVTPQDNTEVKASQDTKSAFTENSAAVKEAGDKAAKAAGTDNLQNLNNLIQNIGCKTGN